ncbi:MAG: efflux RND transporter periplasmic adaptor subunit [Clostridiales bacterium]|nr:efflux RND transporter periplasmic adaptor subunit [Clostridiales bacterium]
MKGRLLLLFAVLATGACLSSCGLMPEEEAIRTAPVIADYQKPLYEFATVQRGELSVTEKITCRYVPVKTENLSFALGGELVDKMLVQVGDVVKEGQLLAQLELNGLDEDIARAERYAEECKLQLAFFEQNCDVERRRHEIGWQSLAPADRQAKALALEAGFDLERRKLEDAIEISRLELEALEKALDKRQIRAPFDGTLTYVRDFEKGEASEFGVRVIVIADSTTSIFKAETEHWQAFEPGETFTLTISKVPYEVVVVDEASLGLEPREKKEGVRAAVYFTMKEPDFTLEEGDFGSVEVVLEYREDTLHVPKGAIESAEDKTLVFYIREDGLRAYKEVVTGIHNAKRVEILSGLEEGEQIIVD